MTASWRLGGVLLSFAAVLLVLFGSFQSLAAGAIVFRGNEQLSVSITSWEMRTDATGVPDFVGGGTVPVNGVPLMFAAAVLLGAALLGLLAAAAPYSAGIRRASGVTAAIGAAFLAGTVWTVGMEVQNWLDTFLAGPESFSPDLDVRRNIGGGFWALLAAMALAVVAAMIAWRPMRERAGREEPDTPRFGVPVVVRLPDEPPDEPPDKPLDKPLNEPPADDHYR